jgi:ATP citrate (pro-S)-lyase
VVDSSPISPNFVYPSSNVAQIKWDSATNAIAPDASLPPWVFTSKLVAKPDQLIKRRGKSGLLLLNKNWSDAKTWITERTGKPVKVRGRGPNAFLTFSSGICLTG